MRPGLNQPVQPLNIARLALQRHDTATVCNFSLPFRSKSYCDDTLMVSSACSPDAELKEQLSEKFLNIFRRIIGNELTQSCVFFHLRRLDELRLRFHVYVETSLNPAPVNLA